MPTDIYRHFISEYDGWDEVDSWGNQQFYTATLSKDFFPFKSGDVVDTISIGLIGVSEPYVQIQHDGKVYEYGLDFVVMVKPKS